MAQKSPAPASFLRPDQHDAIQSMLHAFLRSNDLELELRFGRFRKEFLPGVPIDFFYRFQSKLRSYAEAVTLETRETVFTLYAPSGKHINVKEISSATNARRKSWMAKAPLRKFNLYEHDCRAALSIERCATPEEIASSTHATPSVVRHKHRTQFVLQTPVDSIAIHYDFTKVTCEGHQDPVYEFEVELARRDHTHKRDIRLTGDEFSALLGYIVATIETVQKERQGSFFVLTNSERRKIVDGYRALTGAHFFLGAQPETLQREHIPRLYKEEYSVTDKADGERQFLYVDAGGAVSLLDSNMQPKGTGTFQQDVANSLLDGELIVVDGAFQFHAFDALFVQGQDVRGLDLKRRLEAANNVICRLQNPASPYRYFVKQFFFQNVFLAAKIILDKTSFPYKLDGLVFTPVNEPYPKSRKWPSLLKWKPGHQNTIDFFAKQVDATTWNLYVKGKDAPTKKSQGEPAAPSTDLVPFDINVLCPMLEKESIETFTTSFPEGTIDASTGQPFVSDTVIEFAFDNDSLKFVPLRTRWDKTADKKRHGNFFAIACDIWKNIRFPVTKEYLANFRYRGTERGARDAYFQELRHYHNRVKGNLYNSYVPNGSRVLELCSGKGGDLHKWVHSGVRHVDGYDINEHSIAECNRRVAQLRPQGSFRFTHVDLRRKDILAVLDKGYKYNVVSCQFGLHYFYDAEDTIRRVLHTVSQVLENGGVFLATFIDDQRLDAFMKERDTAFAVADGIIVYYLERRRVTKFSDTLRMYMGGNNVMTETSDEFVVRFGELTVLAKEYGLEVEETRLFQGDEQFKGSPYEKDISALYRYVVFRKSSGDGSGVAAQTVSLAEAAAHAPLDLDISEYFREIQLIQTSWFANSQLLVFNNLRNLATVLNFREYMYNAHAFDGSVSADSFSHFSSNNFILVNNFERVYAGEPLTEGDVTIVTNNRSNVYNVVVSVHHTINTTQRTPSVGESSDSEDGVVVVTVHALLLQGNVFYFETFDPLSFILDLLGPRGGGAHLVDQTEKEREDDRGAQYDQGALQNLKLVDLRILAKQRGLKTSGNKAALVLRISETLKI